jgi:Type I restriction modification DNA specificity domain.
MQLVPLSSIFHIQYGNGLELNKLEAAPIVSEGVNFVSRTSKNNGISEIVRLLPKILPFPEGLITVAVSGSVLETFVQPKPFYTGYHVMVLTPKIAMTEQEKLFYCACIKRNKFRYSYGRQANKSLRNLEVPSQIPNWVNHIDSTLNSNISKPALSVKFNLNTNTWKWFSYSELFEIERGRGPRLKDLKNKGKYPFVTSTDQNNGWSAYTDDLPTHQGNTISVARNGSVGEAFYQSEPFCSTEDVHIFNPKFILNTYIALFLCTLIRMEKYRYNYGRKWSLQRMNESQIKLPSKNNIPDYEFMELFIKSLPYSSSIK